VSTINPFVIIGQVLTAILPKALVDQIQGFIDKVTNLLQGENVLVIGNAAGLIIYFVAKVSGKIPDLTLQDAILQAGTAIVLLNTVLLFIRQNVYSPKTVNAIVHTPPTAAGPIEAAAAVGVDTTQPTTPIDAAPTPPTTEAGAGEAEPDPSELGAATDN
jgi:hypothetical protein